MQSMFVPMLFMLFSGQMAIRPAAQQPCPIKLTGHSIFDSKSVQGGRIDITDLSGSGILAAQGFLRYQFAGGRFHDHVWRYTAAGIPSRSVRLTPEEKPFDSGLVNPIRIEAHVLGAFLGKDETCGETGRTVRSRYESLLVGLRQDAAHAAKLAASLSPSLFLKELNGDFFKVGPYGRESSQSSLTLLRSNLVDADGKLRPEYREWIKRWQDSLQPAKRSLLKQSSPPPGL